MNTTIEYAELVDKSEIRDGQVLVQYSHTEAALAELRQKYAGAKFDLTTTKGDKEARAARLELVTLRTSLEKRRKEFKKPAIEFGKKIDAEAERITAEIRALETPIDEQITADETRRAAEKAERERVEAERVAAHQNRLNAIRSCVARAHGLPSERIANGIDQVEGIVLGVTAWEEFAADAAVAKQETLTAMRAMFDATKAREDELSRVEAQRIENERIAAENRAAADRLAEQQRALDAQAAAIKAENDRLEREAAARAAAEKAEAERLERERAHAAQVESERIAREQREAISQQHIRDEQVSTKPMSDREWAALPAGDRELPHHLVFGSQVIPFGGVDPKFCPGSNPENPQMEELADDGARMTLGEINARIAPVSITVAGLSDLGYEPVAVVKAARLYPASKFKAICQAISAHVLAATVTEAA